MDIRLPRLPVDPEHKRLGRPACHVDVECELLLLIGDLVTSIDLGRLLSFHEHGGPWPAHCIEGTPGWEAHPDLKIEAHHQVFKGRDREVDGYSGWTAELEDFLTKRGTTRVVVVGLALDYCVQATALDARAAGHEVVVLTDATRAVNVKPDDGERALDALRAAGVREDRAE